MPRTEEQRARQAFATARWRTKNSDRHREIERKRCARKRITSPEAEKLAQKKYYTTHREKKLDLAERRRLRHRYGITKEERAALFAAQGRRCAACGTNANVVWHIDHCHHTGRVRGILCHGCNIAAGLAKDSSATLRAIAAYLEAAQ